MGEGREIVGCHTHRPSTQSRPLSRPTLSTPYLPEGPNSWEGKRGMNKGGLAEAGLLREGL